MLLRERLTPALGGALVCALIGTALMVGAGESGLRAGTTVAIGGVLLALASAVSFAAFILLSRLIANRYHPLHSIAIAVSIGAVLLLGISAAKTGIRLTYSLQVWGLLLYLGLVPTALAYALFFHGMEDARLPGRRASPAWQSRWLRRRWRWCSSMRSLARSGSSAAPC